MPKSNKQNSSKDQAPPDNRAKQKDTQDATSNPAIVALGASAGGIQSLKTFFDHLSSDTGLGYLAIVHLDPNQESSLTDILSLHTDMPVLRAKDNLEIKPNHVYVANPGQLIRVSNGKIKLETTVRSSRPIVIDELFESLAIDKKQLCVGIILSGLGSDGTQGAKVIHEQGGLCFAENQDSAEYPDMPKSAVVSGYVDFVGSTKELADKITQIAPKIGRINVIGASDNEKNALSRIFLLLSRRHGIDFEHYKSSTIQRRLQRRITLHKLHSLEDYLDFIVSNPREQDLLCDDLLIKVTEFFRNKTIFDNLCKKVIPEIVKNATTKTKPSVRIWVAGCSTGEEAYSLAICLLECIEHQNIDVTPQVFATDVSDKAIDTARQGFYSNEIEKNVSKVRLQRFFSETAGGYQINKRVRDLCIFAKHNLMQDPPISQLDLISCRNTLIYFSSPLQKKLIPSFHYALNPGGYLWLGDSESTGEFSNLFELKSKDSKVYRKINTGVSRQQHPLFEYSYSPTPLASLRKSDPTEIVDEDKIRELANRMVVNDLGPAGWVVDKDYRMIHIVGKTAQYISPRSGSPSRNLFNTIRDELHLSIRQGIEKIKQKNHYFVKDGITIQSNGDSKTVCVKIRSLRVPSSSSSYFMITIHDSASVLRVSVKDKTTPSETIDGVSSSDEVDQLRQDLGEVRFQMQSALEGQEATNEDLKAANEELLSSNEELRSTNEELQTAKEELQSTNEELGTLNDELNNRNEDLGLLSDDLENFIKSTDTPIIMLDRRLRIRRFTPAVKELFSIISTDTARPLADLKTSFHLPELDDLVLSVMDTLQVIERDIQAENGTWFLLHIRPYKSGDNKISAATLSFTNISERKIIEEGVKSNEEMFRDIVETIREPLLVLTPDLIVTNANESFFNVFLTSKEETIGAKIWDLGNGQWNVRELKKLLTEVLPEQKAFNDLDIEHNFEKIGKKIMRLNARQLDHKSLILLAIEDVTESRKLSDRIKRSEKNFRLLFETAPIAVAITDKTGQFVGFNRSLCTLLGYSQSELLGLTYLQISSQKDFDRKAQLDEELFKGEIPSYELELNLTKKDGNKVAVKLTVIGTESAKGELMHSYGVIEDITSYKEAARKQEQARISAEASDQAKTDFLATMSHEIRTPLSAISGFSELLADRIRLIDHDDNEVQGFVEQIRSNSDFLKNLIDDMLDLARIEAGKINVEKQNFALVDLFGDVVNLLKVQSEKKKIRFTVSSEGNLPVRIYSDAKRLRQVLTNIIGNAIKFTEKGEVSVLINCIEASDAFTSSKLRFVVKDTGIGIAKEHQQRLFQLFSQADSSVTRKYGGTGLGLILSKKIALALGGDVILAKSTVGEGSEFVITLRDCDLGRPDQRMPITMEDLDRSKLKSKRVISHTLGGMKILLAEDCEDIRQLMEHALCAVGGAEVDVAENGKDAVEMGASGQYDLILMDTMMPVMGGYEATRKLKSMGVKTPIVALSARTMKSEIEEGLKAGCEEYLTKPVEMNKLISTVRKYK